MFFLIGLIFLAELIILYIVVSFLLQKDVEILVASSRLEKINTKLQTQLVSIEGICSDLRMILQKKYDAIEKKQRKMILNRTIDILEWFVMFFLKKQGKRFLLGYKLAKYLCKDLKHVL